jgi:hypothetical protein
LYAAYFFEVGLLLVILPWSTLWERNLLLDLVPLVHDVSRSAFVRGAVSGLGIVNLAVGVSLLLEAWHFRGGPPSPVSIVTSIDDASNGRLRP